MATKICSKCGKEKDISEFYFDNINGGPRSMCKKCYNENRKIYRSNLPLNIKMERNKKEYIKTKHTIPRRFSGYKYEAKRKGLTFEMPKEKFAKITSQHCYYCGKFTTGTNFTGIDRICSNKGYIPGNIRPCCEMCNMAKLNYTTNEYLNHCKDVVNYQKKMRK